MMDDKSLPSSHLKPDVDALLPAELSPATKRLVIDFAVALGEKLHAAEQKYGYDDGWRQDGWESQCRTHLYDHLAKGDPRDVANYCAFMWHHGWSTKALGSTKECRADGRCQYAIDHGAEGLGHCPPGKCTLPPPVAAQGETPRTDGAAIPAERVMGLSANPPTIFGDYDSWVRADIARQLERELAELQTRFFSSDPAVAFPSSTAAPIERTLLVGAIADVLDRNKYHDDTDLADDVNVGDLRAICDAALKAPSARKPKEAVLYVRHPNMDKRIKLGDDFAGDAWVRWTAVGAAPFYCEKHAYTGDGPCRETCTKCAANPTGESADGGNKG